MGLGVAFSGVFGLAEIWFFSGPALKFSQLVLL